MISNPSILSTPGFAAHLTYKQTDVMICLIDGPQTARYIGSILQIALDDDLHSGERPPYWGVSAEAVTSTLNILAGRGLVQRHGTGEWKLTFAGQAVAEEYS